MLPVGIHQVRQAVRTFALLFIEADEFVLLEVPRGFVGVPVGFADGDVVLCNIFYFVILPYNKGNLPISPEL